MDHDGLGGEPLAIVATAHVDGGHLTLDFEGTGPQSRGGFNVMPSGVKATVAYACKALLDPFRAPPNSGLFDAVDLAFLKVALNPNFPAAVGARTTTCQKLQVRSSCTDACAFQQRLQIVMTFLRLWSSPAFVRNRSGPTSLETIAAVTVRDVTVMAWGAHASI